MSNRWDNPDEWDAYLAEGNARQPRKRVSADVVLRDEAGRILLVDPAYKPDWDLPGGMAEANEAPRVAAQRELREEPGLDIVVGAVMCVDWVPPHGPWDDSLALRCNALLRHRPVGPSGGLPESGTMRWTQPAGGPDPTLARR